LAQQADLSDQFDRGAAFAHPVWVKQANTGLVATAIFAPISPAMGDFINSSCALAAELPDALNWCHIHSSV
jgi:hypothetical protein